MNKRILGAMFMSAALFSSPALAAHNVASTSQKGSLLIYPAIDVDPEDTANTFIEITNDEVLPIQIECYYVNEKKGRVDFDFELTGKQTASWDVLSGTGTIAAPPFPSDGTFTPGDPARGELVCFAVDVGSTEQVAFNHLTGTATVAHLADLDTLGIQTKQSFRYNAWAFAAKGGPPDYTPVGTPGTLVLSGAGPGTYDACPQYNIASFMPGEGTIVGSGATLGVGPTSIYAIDNDLTVVSCNQDLRQDFLLHLTKLQFTVWNANEESFSGSYACVDSVDEVALDPTDSCVTTGTPPVTTCTVTHVTNFTNPVLQTNNARFEVKGVASTQCPASENAGLLGVLTTSVALGDGTVTLGDDPPEDQELGSTTQGAGVEPGFVLWDPAGTVPQKPKHHK